MEITIKLKVKDVTIELSKEDAVKLKEALEELTGSKVVKEYVPYPYWPPYSWHYWYPNYSSSVLQAPISNDVTVYATMSAN